MDTSKRVVPRVPATKTELREIEARLLGLIRANNLRLAELELKLGALHLGSTCHPDWVSPNNGPGARARRAGIVETILATAGPGGMTLVELAAYLHLPAGRRGVLEADLSYLIEEERAGRLPNRAKKWRITER